MEDRIWILLARKMANEATVEELQEIDVLMKTYPDLNIIQQIINQSGGKLNDQDIFQINKAYAAHLRRMGSMGFYVPDESHFLPSKYDQEIEQVIKKNHFNFKPVYYLLGFATIIMAVCIVYLIHSNDNKQLISSTRNEISTKQGSRSHIILPDGTKVWLNGDSKVVYEKDFGETSRKISLIGEAYFDVAYNKSIPFIIHTALIDIKVLGTEFNVKSYPDESIAETTLIHGTVEITLKEREPDEEKIILKPNEKLVVTRQAADSHSSYVEKPIISLGHVNYYSQDSTILETSWVQNLLVFEDESFGELSQKMKRWYGVRFVFENDTARLLRFTGKFKNESVQEALDAMKITAEFKYSIHHNTVTIQ